MQVPLVNQEVFSSLVCNGIRRAAKSAWPDNGYRETGSMLYAASLVYTVCRSEVHDFRTRLGFVAKEWQYVVGAV